jgi:hypothetical protein
MFVLTALVYPVVLALLCFGAALLVDRVSGGGLPGTLLPAVGAAALIVVSQWTTYIVALAPATPYLLVAVALAGFALGWGRVRVSLSRVAPRSVGAFEAGDSHARPSASDRAGWWVGTMALAFLLALAPVLSAGRPTFSSYMALADSAVHMLGGDYLIRHGQDYAHLDVHNSYGAFVHAYYGSSYPSGADTLFGGGSFLLGLPLIWTFQPFVALMLATAAGPAWLLVRRVGLDRWWAVLASITVTLPALVYAYELIGSVKEIASLPMILGMGALVVGHRRWLRASARGAIPFALLVAAGISTLGVAFGAWALAAAIVLSGAALGRAARPGSPHRNPAVGEAWPGESAQRASRSGALSARDLAFLFAGGVGVLLLAAWPTWSKVAGSLSVAEAIASTSNPGNLQAPLRASQLLGVWLDGSYKLTPSGVALTLTSVLIAAVLTAAVVGFGYAVRARWFALAAWFALSIVLWLALKQWATTWADAKTLMLTSPVVVLAAWTGVAAIRSSPVRVAAPLAALLLAGGVLASDVWLYHNSNLAPTARYEELASINTRFGGRGPTLLTDFDEYALYELRDMDVGDPDFVYPPPSLAAAAGGYGEPVQLNRIAPSALAAYPLIVTRRDPSAVRPPAAYRLLWQGVYYQVWGRRAHAPAALAHVVVSAAPARPRAQCAQVAHVAALARSIGGAQAGVGRSSSDGPKSGAPGSSPTRPAGVPGSSQTRSAAVRLTAALGPELVNVRLGRTQRPRGWGLARHEIVMGRPGTLHADFRLPHGGVWELWLKGEVMRAIHVAVDGRALGSIGGQLDGNSLVANPLTPLRATLSAGLHTLTIARPGANLAPGDGGAAVLNAIFLVPAGGAGEPSLRSVAVGGWRSLCGHRLQWVELSR